MIEMLFAAFLDHFDKATLAGLVRDQETLPKSATPAERMVQLAADLTSLHKVCQIIARNPSLPTDARATLACLERLPPEVIPDSALFEANHLVQKARPDLRPDPVHPKIGRGSVADVFRFEESDSGAKIAFKAARPDAVVRVRKEAAILNEMAEETRMLEGLAEPEFARTATEALRDAARALLREIDFAGEAANLVSARAFYRRNDAVEIPKMLNPVLTEGIFMEFVEGAPLLEIPLTDDEKRQTARLLFRILLLEPIFSGLEESIFHADPHAGNILASRVPATVSSTPFVPFPQRKRILGKIMPAKPPVQLVLLDWSQAGFLPVALRHALIELCLRCSLNQAPPLELLRRIVKGHGEIAPVKLPGVGDPLHKAFDIIEQLASAGSPVPLSLLLLRKSFLTLEGVLHQLDPEFSQWNEMLIYAGWVVSSEAPFRIWSLLMPWLDLPANYRTGLPTQTLAKQLWASLT